MPSRFRPGLTRRRLAFGILACVAVSLLATTFAVENSDTGKTSRLSWTQQSFQPLTLRGIYAAGDDSSDNRVKLADEQARRAPIGLAHNNLPADGNHNGEAGVADDTSSRVKHVPALSSAVTLYPAPNLPASNQYSVQVLVDGIWTTSYVNFDTARTTGSGSSDEPGKTFSWTTFETSEPAKVRVKRLEGTFNSAVVRPSRHRIATTKVASDTVEFTIEPGQKVSVEFDMEVKKNCYASEPHGLDCIKDILMIFADEPQPANPLAGVPTSDIFFVTPGNHFDRLNVSGGSGLTAGKSTLGTAGGKKVIVFNPGVYDIGYWQVPNNVERVHIAGGAVVFGAIDVIPQGRSPFYDSATINSVYRSDWRNQTLRDSFSVDGTGILSGSRLPWHLKKDFTYSSSDDWWAHVKVLQAAATNFTVKGVTLADSPHWTLAFIHDDDDRVTGVFDNFKIVAAWTYNNDGLPNGTGTNSRISNAFIHADDDAIKIYNSGGKVENVVIWQSNNGAAIQFGWFAKSLSNVIISDIDIIHFQNWYGVNQVNRAVFNYANAGGPGTIQDITFNNVNVEGRVLRLFGFNVTSGTQQIKNFTFNNLKSGGMGVGALGAPGRNYFLGNITNFTFNNFVLGGQIVTNAAQAQFDFGNGAGGRFTFSSPAGSAMSVFQLDASECEQGSVDVLLDHKDHGHLKGHNVIELDGWRKWP